MARRGPLDWESGSSDWEGDHCEEHQQEPSEHWTASDSSSSDSSGEEDAAGELVRLLLTLQMAGRMSARTLCLICFLVSRAGCRSPLIKKFAYNPGAQSGKFQRKLDRALQVSAHSASHRIEVPSYTKRGVARQDMATAVEIPYESLLEEFETNPTFEDDLAEAIATRALPKSYYTHDVVRESAAVGGQDARYVVPIGMFMDGVQYLKKASFVAVWIYSLTTGVRHVIAVLKKDTMCRCGCKGWCSLFKIFEFLRWSLTAAADGVYPSRQHDGSEWPAGHIRAAQAGTQMPYRFALVWFKADWAEFATSLGFTTWASRLYPCYMCHCDRDELTTVEPEHAASLPWSRNTGADYEAACRACEITVVIPDRDTHARIAAALEFDRRNKGARGRALQVPVEWGNVALRVGDRLEPSRDLESTFEFDSLRVFPKRVTFWRRANETYTLHRNPLFSIPGFTSDRLVADLLHCLYLGVAQSWIVASLWALLDANVWRTGNQNLSILRLRADLFAYYKTCKDPTVVQNITLKMLGNAKLQCQRPGGQLR